MRPILAALLLCAGCSVPQVVADLDREAPPTELGRPGAVRFAARAGAWAGAAAGAVASIGALPVTYPISLLADEPLGYSKTEFLFAPVTLGASTGHFLLGAPVDMLHYVGYRAWVTHPRPYRYDYTPMRPPVGPGPPSDEEVDAGPPEPVPPGEKPGAPPAGGEQEKGAGGEDRERGR